MLKLKKGNSKCERKREKKKLGVIYSNFMQSEELHNNNAYKKIDCDFYLEMTK